MRGVCAIFDDALSVIKGFAAAAIEKYRNVSRAAKIGAFLAVAMVAVLANVALSGATVAYRVNYDGKFIATVKSKQQFADAVSIVKKKVNGSGVELTVSEPKYAAVLVHGSVIDPANTVADAIIENSEGIVVASALYVNGELTAIAKEAELSQAIEECRTRFDIAGVECVSSFADDIKIEEGYYLAEDLSDSADLKQDIALLAVETKASVVTDTDIEFKTVTKKTNEQLIGYTAVETEGKLGVRRRIESVSYVNGVEVLREAVSDEVVSQPVNKVVVVGTARSKATASEKQYAHSTGFIFPCPKGSWKVSSYYGDGRNHKGVDICADKGVAIFAVAGGTVTASGWHSGGYGYYVTIKHDNGLETRYAHASKLCVKAGQRVEAGDVIARVGSTGNSTGNHLHFEVLRGGRNVDPAPYIGLD